MTIEIIPTLQYIEWFILNLPEIAIYVIWGIVYCFVVVTLGYWLFLAFRDRKMLKIELKYRTKFNFMGFNIIYPPMWVVVILAVFGVVFWFLVWLK